MSHSNRIMTFNGSESSDGFNVAIALITDLRYVATSLNIQVAEWQVIENWLGCKGRDFNDADLVKITEAWRSYEAIGNAPSLSLQPAFDKFRTEAVINEIKVIDIPPQIKSVFDRLIATENEICLKKAYDSARRKVYKEKRLDKLGRQWRTNKVFRIYCFGVGCWIIAALGYPLFFRSCDYGYNGFWSFDNEFLLLALVPSMFIACALLVYDRYIK